MTIAATYYGSNGWLFELGNLRVLVDPWLRGRLSFAPGSWLLRGDLLNEEPIPEHLDLLLLTQGLPDHTHPPTLSILPRELPVVGSASAGKVVKNLGFNNVTVLKPGNSTKLAELKIRATAGAPVPNIENGYILEHAQGSLYIEPHGFLDPTVTFCHLDAVVTPMVDIKIPGLGTFIRGCSAAPQLAEFFQPATILASTTGGQISFHGLLSNFLQVRGSVQSTAADIKSAIRCIEPEPGKRYVLIRAS
ncbi:MBL fold metallo-hydrolase [cyanobiont of Ornithocercus magnificus]|nr:MBL fold metallo-hydrolase [cyanobiont of Ornithocercus magnificus]